MANPIQITAIPASTFVSQTSRYINSTVLYYGDENFITFNTYQKHQSPITSNDKFYIINKGTEYRPDLVSNLAYGIVDLWWRLMEANGIMDVFDFKAGVTIRIPQNISG